MALLGRRVCVAFPDTVLEEKDSLREKTVKLGTIARACSIYRVDIVQVFDDGGGGQERGLIVKVLEFLETPQYLRRRIYPIDEALRFAGALPPLRIPSHKSRTRLDDLKVGEAREGVSNGDGTADIGLEKAIRVDGPLPRGRVTLRIVSKSPLVGETVSREQLKDYWGYEVQCVQPSEVLGGGGEWLNVATSRLGRPLATELGRLRSSVSGARAVRLIFGSPSRGLFDIMGSDLERRADHVVNLFPEQGVVSVRTEEALFAGLNLLGLLSVEKA